MAFNDTFRLSSHGVFQNPAGEILLLKADYGQKTWGLPGGALEPGETIHQALLRECEEELGLNVTISYLSGVYYHCAVNSQAFIFKAELPTEKIILSPEHSAYQYTAIANLSPVQKRRVEDCLHFTGVVTSAKF
ncbi:MAG: 8-oxo-dGTP diphosphatase [Paraglaciecola sp.]|jgi:8-oxo-dGTP diphosphatase